MESPGRSFTSHQSKKRVFPGNSSSCMDPDVFEISPPTNWSSNSKPKKKPIGQHEVIHIDDDPDGIVIIDDELDFSYNGKQPANTSYDNITATKATNVVQSSKSIEHLGNGFSEDDFLFDDAFLSMFENGSIFDDDDAFLQSPFDRTAISTKIKATLPSFIDLDKDEKKVGSGSSSNYSFSHAQLKGNETGSHAGPRDWKNPSSSCWKTQVASNHPYFNFVSSSSAFPMSSSAFPMSSSANYASSLSSKVHWNSPASSSSKWNYAPGISKHAPGYNNETTSSEEYKSALNSLKLNLPIFSHSFNEVNPVNMGTLEITSSEEYKSGLNSVKLNSPIFSHSFIEVNPVNMGTLPLFQPIAATEIYIESLGVNGAVHSAVGSTALSGSTFSIKDLGDHDDIMKKFQQFKQFDTVEDYSDHHYAKSGSSVTQQSKQWAKRIQEEWKILEKDLPDTIFVRVYESRMDLLRAVIVGAQGTPYHDGLFFFDVFFPSGYPSVPPHVYYHSGGLRINPNLYTCGKVCLSLLNTWTGTGNENWIKNVSTMLQVLVSIQALILNENPYFNEPGYAASAKSAAGKQSSQKYSENVLILSVNTMVYSMRRPPKHFEEFVVGYFCKHAEDILGACKVYIEEGVEVGSAVKGVVKNVQGNVNKCSHSFKGNLANYIGMLVQAFVGIGAKDCDKFLYLTQNAGCIGRIPSFPPPA